MGADGTEAHQPMGRECCVCLGLEDFMVMISGQCVLHHSSAIQLLKNIGLDSACLCQQHVRVNVAACGSDLQAAMTVWPSGLRRWLKAPFRKGVGSNPTAVSFSIELGMCMGYHSRAAS